MHMESQLAAMVQMYFVGDVVVYESARESYFLCVIESAEFKEYGWLYGMRRLGAHSSTRVYSSGIKMFLAYRAKDFPIPSPAELEALAAS